MSSKILDLTGRPRTAGTFLKAAVNILGQRRTVILLAGAIVVAALAFNWHWAVAAGLLPILFLALSLTDQVRDFKPAGLSPRGHVGIRRRRPTRMPRSLEPE